MRRLTTPTVEPTTRAEVGYEPAIRSAARAGGPVRTNALGTIEAIDTARIDQWLHAVRLTKTRADAAAAIRGGHVKINGKAAKPSSHVQPGDRVVAFLNRRERVVEVSRPITKRVGAGLAAECFVDHSPPPPERDEVQPLFAVRDRGAGRPTKRDRRRIDRLRGRPS